MKVWTFILIVVGIYLIEVYLLIAIAGWLNLTEEQTNKLMNINLVVANIIGFIVGFCVGNKLDW